MWILPEQVNGFLTSEQKVQLTVLFNTIQPGDSLRKVPNAEQAGAVEYLDLLLARDPAIYAEVTTWKSLYPLILKAVDQQCVEQFTKNLQELTFDECSLLITQLEQGTLKNFHLEVTVMSQSVVFDTLRRHCIQGCFCDPRWGGNRDKVMWSWYGYLEAANDYNP